MNFGRGAPYLRIFLKGSRKMHYQGSRFSRTHVPRLLDFRFQRASRDLQKRVPRYPWEPPMILNLKQILKKLDKCFKIFEFRDPLIGLKGLRRSGWRKLLKKHVSGKLENFPGPSWIFSTPRVAHEPFFAITALVYCFWNSSQTLGSSLLRNLSFKGASYQKFIKVHSSE